METTAEKKEIIVPYDGRIAVATNGYWSFRKQEPSFNSDDLVPNFDIRYGTVYGDNNFRFINYFPAIQGRITWDHIHRMRFMASWTYSESYLVSEVSQDSPLLVVRLKKMSDERILSHEHDKLTPRQLRNIAIAVSRSSPGSATKKCRDLYDILTGSQKGL